MKFFQNKQNLKDKIKKFGLYKTIIIVFIFLIVIFLILRNTIFSREKVGTHKHRVDSPYCESDDECLLYNCTNCGNKYWVKNNDTTECDKEKTLIVGCSCEEGKCKRVLRK